MELSVFQIVGILIGVFVSLCTAITIPLIYAAYNMGKLEAKVVTKDECSKLKNMCSESFKADLNRDEDMMNSRFNDLWHKVDEIHSLILSWSKHVK